MHYIIVWCIFCPSTAWGRFSKSLCLFFGQVLDVITPPYTSDFVQLFLPILENDSIAGTIRTEGEHDPVAEFIGKLSTSLDDMMTFELNALYMDCFCISFLQLTASPTSSWWTETVWSTTFVVILETGSLSWDVPPKCGLPATSTTNFCT